ncbi:hypothetical protein Dsin_013633 [Dipteronia sinensis]|uniref:Uncharacterized protein n=1 Tax=Dipteronia sinensis TaxID=43782 RepID=A0AAE0AKU6_9ROSI|nr:hypothetical protein Dsin_013633 [Dipteronia sinensis]
MKTLREQIKELQNDVFNNQSPLGVSTGENDVSPQKGTKCKLLHWIGSGQVVAEAELIALIHKHSFITSFLVRIIGEFV